MKTKDFIKMLQEEDPTGEGYIRMNGGIPVFVESKPGYWDGPYEYIDEKGNFVYSTKGYKIDIHSLEISDFVEKIYSHHNKEKNTWEYVKSKFKCELTYSNKESNDSRFNSILKQAKEAFDDIVEIENRMWEKELSDALQHQKEGWTWFQNKEVGNPDNKISSKHHYYTWKIYNGTGKEEGSNLYNTLPILKSGLFEKLDNNKKEGYYEWILK